MAEKRHIFISSIVALLISIVLYPPVLLFVLGIASGVYVWRVFERFGDDVKILLIVIPVALAFVGISVPAFAALAAGFALSVIVLHLAERL